MFQSELKLLFSEKEIELFLGCLSSWNKFINCEGILETYFYEEHIQQFISIMEDNERKEEILSICIEKFPSILGLKKENI